MKAFQIVATVLICAHSLAAQSNLYCGRVVGHTPFYERIFLPKGSLLRPASLRGMDDLEPSLKHPETNRFEQLLAEQSKERTNGFYQSCLPEVPVHTMSLHCPGDLLERDQIESFLRYTVAVPRASWTNHWSHAGRSGESLVLSLTIPNIGKTQIDLKPGSCGLVVFPDGTYRCVMDKSYFCLKSPQEVIVPRASPPSR
jgi:hypothetical protein